MLLLLTTLFNSCGKDEAVDEKPTLIGKWICIANTNETYKLTFASNNSYSMSISMPSQNFNGTSGGTYIYNETRKIISFTVTSGNMGSSITDYENVKFISTSKWQATVGGAALVWNKE